MQRVELNMADLFDTAEKIDNAVALFKSLILSPGWQLYVQIADENIELIKQQIIDNPEGLDEAGVNLLRDRLHVMQDMRNKPQDIIKQYTTESEPDPEDDPFDTTETLTKRSADDEIKKT